MPSIIPDRGGARDALDAAGDMAQMWPSMLAVPRRGGAWGAPGEDGTGKVG